MPTKLTRQQRNELFDALLAAFPGWDELQLMARRQLDKNLAEISARSNPLTAVVLDLIVWAEAGGYLAELTDGALAQQPNNPQLKSFAATMTAATPPPAPQVTAPGTPVVPDAAAKEQYERLIWRAVQFAGTAEFREAMIRRERAVCRVEFPEGDGQGTGFLLGRDLVITNYHVLEDFIEGREPPQAVRCRFDYQENAAGTKVSDGRVVSLAGADWLVRRSPADELDFALVRLAEPAGDDAMTGGPTRGWLAPIAHTFSIGESVFVIQHPKAAPLKIAAGGVAQVQDRRVQYLANTLEGSSGSPCFTSDWTLAALHRGSNGIANIGIPFAAILAEFQKAPAVTLG